MKIYNSEKTIGHLIESKTNASLVVPIGLTEDKTEVFIDSLKDMQRFDSKVQKTLARVADEASPDLMYGSAILVSTALNKNDDVFLPDETWKARATPIHQPYNDDHVEEDIIGHIIASRVLDSDDKLVVLKDGETPPVFFNIEVDFVVYKGIFPAIAKEIAEKGPKGQKFVSMEAKFNDFDYALIESSKDIKIYARNEETAFLTKYLKAYGGEGKYRDQRIGRVLRNFRFVGMGNVDVPANPASEFTKLESFESASLKELKSESKTIIYITKGNIMEIKTLEDAQKVIADLQTKLTGFESKATEQAQAALNTEKSKADLATQKYTEANTKVEQLTTELTTIKASLVEKTAELDKITKASKAADRLSQLKTLGHEVSDETKKNAYASMSDEAFASILDFAKTFAKKTKGDSEDGDGDGMGADASKDGKKDKKEDKDSKASKDGGESKKDKKADDDDSEDDDTKAAKDKKDNKSDASAVAKFVKDAKDALDKVTAATTSDITRTSGDTSSNEEKIQKTAAKLVAGLRKSRSTERFGRKASKKD